MTATSSSSEASSRKKRAEKRRKKAGKREKKDNRKHKKADKKAKKRKAASSGLSPSTSSAGGRARKKAKKSGSSAAEEVQQRWILGREKAIRKAEPDLPKDEALKRAVAEYMQIYDVGLERPAREEATAGAAALQHQPSIPDHASVEAPIRSARVAETVAEAVREAAEAARAAGLPEAEVQAEAFKAREAVLRVAEQAGLYKANSEKRLEEMSLFLQEKDRELQEYVRKGVPSTDDRPRHVARAAEPGQLDLTRLRLLPQV